jgi:hypothetical protein
MRYSTRQGLRAGIAFGLFFGFFQGVINGLAGGIAAGVLAGVLFGIFIAWMLRRNERIWAELRVPYESEGIVHHGPANCAIGPGLLMLTAKRLVWIPQQEKKRDKKIVIAREAITNVAPGRGIGPQVRIEVHTGESVEFLVHDRNAWLQHLRGALRSPLPTARQVP